MVQPWKTRPATERRGTAASHERMPQTEETILPGAARRSFSLPSPDLTDPDSRQMHDNGHGCMMQGYNAQLAVDGKKQVIVAADVTQEVLDRGQLLAMMKAVERNTGQRPELFTADAGYWDTATVQEALQSGVQVLVPPDGAAALEAGEPRQMGKIHWPRGCAKCSIPKLAAPCTKCVKPWSSRCSDSSRRCVASDVSSYVVSRACRPSGESSALPTIFSSFSDIAGSRPTHEVV